MGTLNNYTHLLPLLINVTSASGFKIWNEMLNINRKFCQRNPSKKKQESFLNILETEDSYFKPDEIMCYINSNTAKLKQIVLAVEKIFLLCTQILKDFLSFTMNVFHFPFSFLVYLLMFFKMYYCHINFTVNKICSKFYFLEKLVLTT